MDCFCVVFFVVFVYDDFVVGWVGVYEVLEVFGVYVCWCGGVECGVD